MNSERSYTVIALVDGDGDNSGYRIWSARFNSRASADQAAAFLQQTQNTPPIRLRIIEDCP
jgi:hypothetical protein